jgi:hypothetical protein
MSNNKQSSIELFAIALYEGGYLQGNGDQIDELLERHKAIHKEEIEDAHWYGGQDVAIYERKTFGGNYE